MAKSSSGGRRRGSPHGSPVGKQSRAPRGALGPNRKAIATMESEPKKILMRQSSVAPRAEPSTEGAKQWTSGRKQARKHR